MFYMKALFLLARQFISLHFLYYMYYLSEKLGILFVKLLTLSQSKFSIMSNGGMNGYAPRGQPNQRKPNGISTHGNSAQSNGQLAGQGDASTREQLLRLEFLFIHVDWKYDERLSHVLVLFRG